MRQPGAAGAERATGAARPNPTRAERSLPVATHTPGARPLHPAAPVAAAALAAALFIGMDATAKSLSTQLDAVQVAFWRFASGSLFALPLWAWRRTPLPRGAGLRRHGLRAVLLVATLLTWFFALGRLQLVQAVAVGYTAPIFISLLAMLWLREQPSRWIWAALALGAAGVAVALLPELRHAGGGASHGRVLGLLSAAASALCYSATVVVARRQAQDDALWSILLLQNLLPLALLAPWAAWTWHTPAPGQWPAVLLLGALATGGLLAFTFALTHLEASRIAPLEYSGLVWATALGWLLFGEVPGLASLGSALLIIAGCALLLRR